MTVLEILDRYAESSLKRPSTGRDARDTPVRECRKWRNRCLLSHPATPSQIRAISPLRITSACDSSAPPETPGERHWVFSSPFLLSYGTGGLPGLLKLNIVAALTVRTVIACYVKSDSRMASERQGPRADIASDIDNQRALREHLLRYNYACCT